MRSLLWLLIIFLFTGNVENCDAVIPKRNKFIVGQLNICGLFGKIDLLTLFIEKHNFDIFGITESLLNENISSSLLNIKGYSFERKDRRGQKGGGVGVFIKSNIDYIRREDLENQQLEFICLEILSKHTKLYFVCVLYRPTNTLDGRPVCFLLPKGALLFHPRK